MRFSPEYIAYLNSQEWAAKRATYWAKYGRRCQACGSNAQLEVDHLTYERLGHELMTDLLGLCHDCHVKVTKARRRAHATPGESYRRVTELLFGIALPGRRPAKARAKQRSRRKPKPRNKRPPKKPPGRAEPKIVVREQEAHVLIEGVPFVRKVIRPS